MKAKYINPFTDFGFKQIFGAEASKPELIDLQQVIDLGFEKANENGILIVSKGLKSFGIEKEKIIQLSEMYSAANENYN